MPVENEIDLVTRQREMKKRMKELKRSDPEAWEAQEEKDRQTLLREFNYDGAGHKRSK